MEIILIAALSKNNVIGKGGTIPWHIKEDFDRFKEVTLNHSCIMGRGTFESIPPNHRPLEGRENIILTGRQDYHPEGTVIKHSLTDALDYCKEKGEETVYIIGGQRVYEEALPVATVLDLTRIHKEFEGDTYFPEFNEDEWEVVSKEDHEDKKVGPYSFMIYKRK